MSKHTLKTLESTGISWDAVLGMTTAEARKLWASHRNGQAVPLLTEPDANAKLAKDHVGWLPWSLSLAPHRDGGTNVCPASTPACRKHCVSYSGKGGLTTTQIARQRRVSFLMTQPVAFMRLLVDEIDRAVVKCEKLDIGCAVRLNAFSDVAWERVVPWLFEMFDTVQFYDYTKRSDRGVGGFVPPNYSLTLSATERTTDAMVRDFVGRGSNVAVIMNVTRGHDLPETYAGVAVVDGDKSDLRFKDPQGVIVGLRAKGSLIKHDAHGFSRDVAVAVS